MRIILGGIAAQANMFETGLEGKMDREDVIKGLECCNEYNTAEQCDCPYQPLHRRDKCLFELHADALALLKAQEAMKPVLDIDTWTCGNCGHTLEHQQLLGDNALLHEQYNYCPECGKAVKWDG